MSPEEDISERIPAFLAGIKLLDQRCRGIGDPGFGDGFARAEDDNGGRVGPRDGADKGRLGADEVEGREVDVLAGCCVEAFPEFGLVSAPGADDDDGDISALGGFDGFVEARLVITPFLAALCVDDFAVASDGCFDASEGGDSALVRLVEYVVAVLDKILY